MTEYGPRPDPDKKGPRKDMKAMKKRVFLIVLDSFGIGEMPDASRFGDEGSNTLSAVSESPEFHCPTMTDLGLFRIDGVTPTAPNSEPRAVYARLTEASGGKDTTIGHWEIAGLITQDPMPTYPNGIPDEVLAELTARTGYEWLCNQPYSGTDVIRDYGREHLKTRKLILYTSADSVMQIAAHEDLIPVEELYRVCMIARETLTTAWGGRHAVGRVIARPFAGEYPFARTSRRHDYSVAPPAPTMLDTIRVAGMETIAVGKITDIFAGQGITETVRTPHNAAGMSATVEIAAREFAGLCFTNLVDFDMLYGHRNDRDGYARALTEFDTWLADFLPQIGKDDLLIITADHGCDPSTPSTDHSREYTPLLMYSPALIPQDLGTRPTFADIAATTLFWLGLPTDTVAGKSLLPL